MPGLFDFVTQIPAKIASDVAAAKTAAATAQLAAKATADATGLAPGSVAYQVAYQEALNQHISANQAKWFSDHGNNSDPTADGAHFYGGGTIENVNNDDASQQPGLTGSLTVGGKYASIGATGGMLAPGAGGYKWAWEPSTKSGQPGPRLIVSGPATIPYKPDAIVGTQFLGHSSKDWNGPCEWIFGQFGLPDLEILGQQAMAEIAAKRGATEAARFAADPQGWVTDNQLVGGTIKWSKSGPSVVVCPDWPPGFDVGKVVLDGLTIIAGAVSTLVSGPGGATAAVAGGIALANDASNQNEPATSNAVQMAAAQAQAVALAQASAQGEAEQNGAGLPAGAGGLGGLPSPTKRKIWWGVAIAAGLAAFGGLVWYALEGE